MNKKLKNNLYVVIGVVLVVLLSYLYLLSSIRDIQNGDLLTAVSNLKTLELAQANYSIYDKVLRETADNRAALDGFMVGKKTIANFIEKLESLAKHTNVEIVKTLSIEKNPQRAGESLLKFALKVKGRFSDVRYFVLLLENMPQKIRIRRLAMATSDASAPASSSGVMALARVAGEEKSVEGFWAADINFELLSFINE